MAKVRIYEIAKELKIQPKEVVEFLKEKNITGKVASSSIEDDTITMVKNKFIAPKTETEVQRQEKKGAEKEQEPKKVEKPKKVEEPKKDGASQEKKPLERPRKKASITAVYNPQNSKTAPKRQRMDRNKAQGERANKPQAERAVARPDEPAAKVRENVRKGKEERQEKLQEGKKPLEMQQEKGGKPQGTQQEKASRPNTELPAGTPEEKSGRPLEERSRSQAEKPKEEQERNVRPAAERAQGARPGMDRDRNGRPGGDRDRNGRPEGDRGNRFQGNRDRNGRSGMDRDRNTRPGGDRNGRNGQNTRPGQGGRPNQRNRFEQEINKMNQGSQSVSMDEARGKESRDRDSRKGGSQRHEKELMGRKKERFDNLEKKTRGKKNQQPQHAQQPKEETIKNITLPEKLTIKELADRMKVQASAIIKKLFLQGNVVTVNNEIDFATAEEIALEFNCICEQEEKIDVIAELLKEAEEDASTQVKRPPVVCVMGHVDHGKTSLLDAIRDTHVIDKEAGGITQHIGAYMVECNGEKITFLDTPGHEAFTAMRMRGANATDIAILVVAADDGVMPQTVEAISHAKAAEVEIIVAINKIDKPSANIERVKQELAEYELIPEDWGGSTIFVPVSAHTHEGIDNLLEMVLLTAEISELKANPKRNARGLVIEAQLDKGRGSVATILVQKGTLKVGQPVACGSCYGKVRAMIDDKGRRVKEAGPSTPVEILGLNNVPNAGEIFVCTDSEKEAKSFADTFISEGREKMLEDTRSRMSLDDLFSQIQSGNIKELPIIVKADVQGSVEAVKQSLVKLSNEEVVVKVIHGGVGAINESDVSLASASNAIIIGFNVRPDATAKATAEREGVDMRLYKVIYNAIEDVQSAMKGMLDPVFEEKILGHAEVRQIFKSSGVGNIAGSYVLDGMFQRGCKVRISREGEQIFEGNLASLKRFKDDVKEVKAGYECGLVFEGFGDIQELDIVESYIMVEVPR